MGMEVGISGHEWVRRRLEVGRALNRLSAREVATLKDVGRHADGGGLYLRISASGGRSWVFMSTVDGKRTEVGLGAARSLTLASARSLAGSMREAVALGRDPRRLIEKEPEPETRPTPTFGDFAEDFISSVEAGWKNPTHRLQWRTSLRDHAAKLTTVPIDKIDTDLVLDVLKPIWLAKAETASRVRGRIEKILDAAKARGFRPKDALNPAALRGHLSLLLPKQSGMARGHHKALPYSQMPAFMAALARREALAARCLEFTILTAARSGEALGARWSEIDFERQQWTVPAERMKAGREHIVPLSTRAISVLQTLVPDSERPSPKVFSINGAARSNMAMTMLLRRMNVDDATVHGFRSTFRDWAGDETNFPRELIEQALAHTVASKVERAYRRGTAIERRRELMETWAQFVTGSEHSGKAEL